MIRRFYSPEDAAIHAGVMRSHGHAAAVLDEVVGTLYGPVLTNGYRVWVSDDPVTAEEDADDDAAPAADAETTASNPLMDALRVLVGALMALGVVAIGIAGVGLIMAILFVIKSQLLEKRAYDPDATSDLLLVLVPLGLAAVVVLSIPFLGSLTRSFRDTSSPLGWCFRGLVIIYVVMELGWVAISFLAEVFGFYQDCLL